MGAPGLVLFDEPSQGLAPKVVQDVMSAVLRLKREGVASILVEQNVASPLGVADTVCVMRSGCIVHQCNRRRCGRTQGCAAAGWESEVEAPLLKVEGLVKRYNAGWPRRRTTFDLQADFEIAGPAIVRIMGANGAGKTTPFELMTGGNRPTSGRVLIAGQDIHKVRYEERGRLALHYHPSYQLRSFTRGLPSFMLQRSRSELPRVHLFDEPQFNTQDGYIGFMLDFFRRLRSQGRLVFLCLHPNEPVHLEILSESATGTSSCRRTRWG